MLAQQEDIFDGVGFARRDDALLQLKGFGVSDPSEIDEQARQRSEIGDDW